MEVKRPFSQIDWLSIPEPVREYIIYLERLIGQMQQRLDAVEKRTEKLEARTRINSQNSSKPPSSDSPFNKQKKKTQKSKAKRGGQKGHKGCRQQMLDPTKTINVMPKSCNCGKLSLDPDSIEPFYTHQHIELPKIRLDVTHFILHRGKCQCCGKTVKPTIPCHGNRWVERILSLKQTCRMRALPVFPILVNAIESYFKDQSPDLDWITAL